MSLYSAALEGLLLGLSLIIAIGAQNAFVLRQGLARMHVLPIALVCALADGILIMLGVAGLGTLVQQSPDLLSFITLAGAAFLSWYAIRAAVRVFRPGVLDASGGAVTSLNAVLGMTIAFTLFNPHVYLDTVVLFGGLSTRYQDGARIAFASGGVLASFFWFFGLAYGARLLAPLFARPIAWRVLDALIALIMAALAASLLLAF